MWAIIERAKKILIVLFLSSLPLLLIFIQNKNQEIKFFLSWPVIETAGRIEQLTLGIVGGLSDWFFRYFYWSNRADELRNLRSKVEEADKLRYRVKDLINEKASLLELDLIAANNGYDNSQKAQVIARTGSPLSRMIRIDKGSRHQIRQKDPVISHEGIVGQVLAVSLNFSDVLLVTDPSSAFEAKLINSNARGLCRGVASSFKYLLEITDIDPLENPKIGDIVMSSGINSQIPFGLLVGKVFEIQKSDDGLSLKAKVDPFVKFRQLDYVLVLINQDPENKADIYSSPWPLKAK